MRRKRRRRPLTGETKHISEEFRPDTKNPERGPTAPHLLAREGLKLCCGETLQLVRLCLASTLAVRERSALRHLARRFWNQTFNADMQARS